MLFIAVETVHLNEYAITPGVATSVAPLVTIHGVATNPHHDTIMLADVYLQQLTLWDWLGYHFQSHVQYESGDEVNLPGVPARELNAQGYLEMSDAKHAAAAAAFRALGWTIPSSRSGAVVFGVVSPSPAYAAGLHVGDRIVKADGTVIRSSCQLIGFVHALAPGTSLRLIVDRVSISRAGVLTYRPPSTLSVTTAPTSSSSTVEGCPGVTGRNRSFLGVSLEDGVTFKVPATISINTAGIGGPSGGLAMTLTLINQLSRGSLTGHHVIAATGTMDANGDVGPVGGVEEKAVAVHRAGARYFFVPDFGGDVAAARDAHQPNLRIVPVKTLGQVLRDLKKLGGTTPQSLTRPS